MTISRLSSLARLGLTAALIAALAVSCSSKEAKLQMNAPLVTHIHTADPSAHVFEGSLYIYPSHDIEGNKAYSGNGDQYDMEDYHVLSMKRPGSEVTDHGEALHLKNVPWASAQMWAPDAAFINGAYVLYFPAKDKDGVFRIGAATASSPAGPFTARETPIEGSFSMDPAVFADSDGSHYMVFGGLWGGQLEKWQTGTYVSGASGPRGLTPALGPRIAKLSADGLSFAETPRELVIVDEQGKPLAARDTARRFFEGAWLHAHKGLYYLSYSTGDTHLIVYATSDSLYGPYTYRGKILDPVKGWTTHHSIVKFEGKWYFFYHDSSRSGKDHLRDVMYTELRYGKNGEILPVTR
jgi:beta-xylosidase